MDPLRLLVIAAPADAQRAVDAIREGGAVEAALAPTADALRTGLADPSWNAVLIVPGGPVLHADLADALAGETRPVVVAGESVPPDLADAVTMALVWEALDALPLVVGGFLTETDDSWDLGGDTVETHPFFSGVSDPMPDPTQAFVEAPTPVEASAPAEEPPVVVPAETPHEAPGAPAFASAFAPLPEPDASSVPEEPSEPMSEPPVAWEMPGAWTEPDAVPVDDLTLHAPPLALADDVSPADDLLPTDHGSPAAGEEIAAADEARLADERAVAGTTQETWESLPLSDEPEVSRLAEHLPIGVYRSTPDGRILSANPALATLLGCESVDALADIDVRRDLGYPREAFVERIHAEGEVRNLVVSWTDRAGRTVHTRENARAVIDAAGIVLYFEGTMEDVTAEVEAREAERQRARQHAAVAHFAAAADAARTPEALHDAAVRALLDATGADGVLLAEHVRPESGAPFNRCAAVAGDLLDGAAQVLDADPAFVGMAYAAAPALVRDAAERAPDHLPASVRDAMLARGIRSAGAFPLMRAGELLGALVVVYRAPHTFSTSETQVAEALAWHLAGHLARHHAERELHDSEASLRFIAEHTGQVLYRIRYAEAPGGSWAFDYLSPAIEALTGYDADALAAAGGIGSLIEHREVFAGEGLIDGPLDGSCDAHYLAVYRLATRDGQTRWVENSAYPWCEDGHPVGLVGVMHDVTDRRRLEEASADAAQQVFARQTALVDLARHDHADLGALLARVAEVAAETTGADAAAVWLTDGAWVVRRAAQVAPGAEAPGAVSLPVEAFEAAMERLHGERVLASPADAPAGLDAFAGGAAGVVAAPIRRRGEAVGLLVLAGDAAAWSNGEPDFAAALADTVALALERDERARAETALRRSEARYRALADLTSDYAFAVHRRPDGASAVAWATDAFERITGHPAEALLDPAQRAAVVRPDSLDDAAAVLDTMPSADGGAVEIELDDRAGESRWIAHRARVAEVGPDGTALVYHSGQDVTERRRALAAIVAAREQAEAGREAAEAMARLKSAFLANMSHEIRTPLTSILGYSELLIGEVSDEHREFVDLISRGGRRLLDTLNSLLDLARLEADSVRPDPRRLSVGAEVGAALAPLRPLADEAGLDLQVHLDDAAEATLDRACLARVVAHLVGNAIKFTPEGVVRVDVWTAGDEVVLRVADSGIGIAPEFLPHLFDEFRQEEIGDGRSHEGAGLGLSITRRLVTLMGGRIDVDSRRPGGSTFTVTFPAAAPLDGAVASDSAPSASTAPTAMTDHPFGQPSAPAPAAPAPAAVAPVAPWAAPVAEPETAAPPTAAPAFAHDLVPPVTASAPVAAPAMAPEPAVAVADPLPAVEAPPSVEALPVADRVATLEAMAERPWGTTPVMPDPVAVAAPVAPPAVASPPPAPFATIPAPEPVMVPAPMPEPTPAPEPVMASVFAPAVEQVVAPPVAPAVATWPEAPEPTPAEAATRLPDTVEPVMIVRPSPPPEPAPAPEPEDGRPAILVVEDNADTRMLLDRILRSAYRVTSVGDARSALIEMNRQQFHGFVLDINLGGKETGTDVLRIARTLDGYASVFAIALTAYALPGDRDRLLEAGFDEYLSKPFTRQALLDALAAGVRV